MRDLESCGTITLCERCQYANEYGVSEVHDIEPGTPVPLNLIGIDYTLIAGTDEHSDLCTDSDREVGCDCADTGFVWGSCDGCGVSGFNGHKATAGRLTRKGLRAALLTALDAAHSADSPAVKSERLADAAAWRRIIAQRIAEDRRFKNWLARVNAERTAQS